MENQNTKSQEKETTNQELQVEGEVQTPSPQDIVQDEISELEKIQAELAELNDANLRLIAEMQNTHRRSQEEIKKARDYAISNFAKEVITVRDYLEMALKDQSGNFEMLKMGVDLTLQQILKIFDGQQIKEINPQPQEKLDANLHQAMSIVEEHTQEPNTVVAVMQKGYILNGRVLRAAMVTVAK